MDTVKKRISVINNTTIALIALSFVLTFLSPVAHAGWFADKAASVLGLDVEEGFTDNSLGMRMLKDLALGMKGVVDKALNETNAVYQIAVGGVSEDGSTWGSDDFNNAARALFASFKVIAGLWCCAIAMARFIQNVDKGIDPFEAIFKVLIELCIVTIFIMYLAKIVGIICNLGVSFIDMINEKFMMGEEEAEDLNAAALELLEKLKGKTTGTALWRMEVVITLFFPWMGCKLVNFAAQLAIYQVFIEIGIRRIFTPLAIGDIYQEGLRSPGVRYLKKLLAAYLKIGVICIAGWFSRELSFSVVTTDTDALTFLFDTITVNAVCCMTMFKAGEYTNDIVGV